MSETVKLAKGLRIINDVFELGEQQVIIDSDYQGSRITIHPWDRSRQRSSVAVSLGLLNKKGEPRIITKKLRKRGYTEDNAHLIEIFERERFVEGLLAVFPELQRAPA